MNYDRERFQNRWKPAEGWRGTVYRCPAGYLSVGWGHNLETNPLSLKVSQLILDEDMERAERDLTLALPWVDELDPVRQAAVLELSMNMGLGDRHRGLLSFWPSTLPALERGDWPTAVTGLAASKWANDVGPARSRRVMRMILTGEDQG